MEFFFRLEQPLWLLILIPCVLALVLMRRFWHKATVYRYALASSFKKHAHASKHPFQKISYLVRLLSLIILALLVAKPQMVDSRSNMVVEGIDIMLVMDVSGSMQNQDFSDDRRSRFDIAKEEAIRFIDKRVNDSLGLVLFAKDALSRCPLTYDKHILKELVGNLALGDLDPDGTMLATGMVTALNRLKTSKAKSKVIILLTDGEPSEGDMNPNQACEIAKKLNVKVYTIGIGSDKDEIVMHPMWGLIQKPKVNAALLRHIARETGGQFFMAHNAQDMREVYEKIDELEKTKHETPVYTRYFDLYTPWSLAVFGLCVMQIIMSTFMWFII